jgi:hypothetical protein
MKLAIKYILAATVIAVLTACGGGGGGSGAATNVDPQGIWAGPASTGYTVNAVVLETGETWGVYTSGSTIYGALYGSAAVNGSSISINGTDFNFLTNSSSSGNLSGTVTARSSMSLSGSGVSVPLTYQSSYDSPATAAAAMGTWSFVGRSGAYTLIPGSITIDGSGRFVLNQTNCVTTGSILPRAGGKNIYNISLSSTGIGCAAGQSTLTGVTYLDTSVSPNKFLALALTSNRSDGLIVIGTKQ